MRLVIQRVDRASVVIEEEIHSKINEGILALVGLSKGDDSEKFPAIIDKLFNLRIFPDEKGEFNQSLIDSKKDLLLVSQFTLYANLDNGRRPDFSQAMPSNLAMNLYNEFVKMCIQRGEKHGISVKEGKFQSFMKVNLINSGPVTLILDK